MGERTHGGGHGHDHGPGWDRHGNPDHLDAYVASLDDPDRIAWQKPDEVIAALEVSRGQIVCDVGAGTGTFALRLARAVGPEGRVHAVDVDPRLLEILERRARETGAANVRLLLAGQAEEALPPECCDRILLVNSFHHVPDGAATLRRLAGRLAPEGRIAVVDYHDRDLPVGPPPDHRVSRAAFLAAAGGAGLAVLREETFLPYQWFFVLRPA